MGHGEKTKILHVRGDSYKKACDRVIGIEREGESERKEILREIEWERDYGDEVLRWPMVLNKIDKVYVLEYAIADRQVKLLMHFRSWDM